MQGPRELGKMILDWGIKIEANEKILGLQPEKAVSYGGSWLDLHGIKGT